MLSFFLDVVLTIGVMMLIRRCKEHRRAARHILGKSKKGVHGKTGPSQDMDWGPQFSPPFYMAPAMMPNAPPAPYPGPTKPSVATILWPSNALQWEMPPTTTTNPVFTFTIPFCCLPYLLPPGTFSGGELSSLYYMAMTLQLNSQDIFTHIYHYLPMDQKLNG